MWRRRKEDTVSSPSLASYYLKLLTKSTLKYKPTKFRMYFFLPITVAHISMPRVVNVMELDILNHLYYFPKICVSHFRKCKTQTVGRFLDNILKYISFLIFPEMKFSWIPLFFSYSLKYWNIKTCFLQAYRFF